MYTQISNYLQEIGTTIITPNNRLARILLDDYLKRRRLIVAPKPRCQSYAVFLQKIYNHYIYTNPAANHPCLLTNHQQRYLWNQILSEDSYVIHEGLVQKIIEAWSHCQLWQVNIASPLFDYTPQTQKFRQWTIKFLAALKTRNAITAEQIIPHLAGHAINYASKYVWFCFDDYTAQQKNLHKSIETHAGINIHLDLRDPDAAPSPNKTQIYIARDDQDELANVIAWLKTQLNLERRQIGVVVHDLKHQAPALKRLLQQQLPEQCFNISLGKMLADYALVSHALNLLQLDRLYANKETVSILLQTPFLINAANNFLLRSQFLHEERLLQERYIDYRALILKLRECDPSLAEKLENLPSLPEKAHIHDWATAFEARLSYLGFPGEYSLNSETYQCYQRLLILFDEFRQLAIITPVISKEAAFAALSDLAQHTIFQAQHPHASIQILGLLEAAGCYFDALWVIRMTDEAFPQQTKFSPFIPLDLQRHHGLPYTNPKKEYTLSKKTITRLQSSSPDIIFSYSSYSEDKPNRLAPLFDLMQIQFLPTQTPQHSEHTSSILVNYFDSYKQYAHQTLHRGTTTMLANQSKCPFRAFAAHKLHVKTPIKMFDGLNHVERGQVMHKALEILWQKIRTQENLLTLDHKAMLQIITEVSQLALLPYNKLDLYSFAEVFQQLEQQRLHRLLSTLLVWEKTRPNFTVLATEQEYSLTLNDVTFNVRIDRLDNMQTDEKLVIDYKSTLPNTFPWYEERPLEPQILLYALLDDKINTIILTELKHGQLACKGLSATSQAIPGIHAIKEHENWQQIRCVWRKKILSLIDEFNHGNYEPRPVHKKICGQCDFKSLCRLEMD